MVEAGILDSAERLELLNGQIVEMSPIGKWHWELHARLVAYLNRTLPGHVIAVGQGSFPLGQRSEPQPDIAIVRRSVEKPRRVLDPVSIVAFIEIADSSLATDIGPKMRLYGRFDVPDYIVIDVRGGRVILHSAPHELGYADVSELMRSGVFTLSALPETLLETDEFFPDPD